MGKSFDIDVIHYVDDGVWVATSEDVKGLTVEADSFENFVEALIEVCIELLAHNHGLTEDEIGESTIRVSQLDHIRTGRALTVRPEQGCVARPKVVLQDLAQVAVAA